MISCLLVHRFNTDGYRWSSQVCRLQMCLLDVDLVLDVGAEGGPAEHQDEGHEEAEHHQGLEPGLELSTNLREVSQCPEKAPTRTSSLLKAPTCTSTKNLFKDTTKLA